MDLKKRGNDRTVGNQACIQLLEKLLREAKRGRMDHLAVAVAVAPDHLFATSSGSIVFQDAIADALEDLADSLRKKQAGRWAPVNPDVSGDHVTFSVQVHNVNYDFLPWLVGAEMHRLRTGGPAPLKVAFYNAGQQDMNIPRVQLQMMRNVVGPLVQAIGGQIAPVDINRCGKGDFAIGYCDIVKAHEAGEAIPKFKAPELAKGAIDALFDGLPDPITITLRECPYHQQRNSNLKAWTKFAGDLVKKGENVVFVRDTNKAEEPLPGFTTLPVASENTLIRIALYERAKANLFVSNGPATINWHLDTPFLMFVELDPEHIGDYPPARPEWWKPFHGITAGEQFPWFNARQRIVWESDTYSHISAAWEQFASAARNAAA